MNLSIITSGPAYHPSNPRSDQPRWRRRAIHPGGTFWLRFFGILLLSSMLLSTVGVIPANALSAPALLSPANSSTITTVEASPLAIPEFQWEAVAGATKYRLQVSSDTAFTTKIIDITTSNTTYTHTISSSFSDGPWYWRVKVESPVPPLPAVNDYSSIWIFTKQWATPTNAPSLTSPADFATIDFYDSPVFSWSPVMGAAKYKFRIYSSSGSCLASPDTATTLTTIYQPSLKISNGTYYWCVIPVDPGNHNGTPSQERSFNAGYNTNVSLLKPDDGATPTFTPTFSWTAVRGAQTYRLQYATDDAFTTGVITKDTKNTSYTPTGALPNDVNYYWRVRVISGNSITDWTPYRRFVKRWYIKPVLLTPTNNYQDQRFPIYSWTPVPGAAKYFVEISRNDPNFTIIYDSGYTANTFYSPQIHNGASTTYYWRVTPYDGSNNKGKVSNTSSYVSYGTSVAPEQVYPLYYYYPPDTYSTFPDVPANIINEDRTVPLPIFIWHRVYRPATDLAQGQNYASGYRLQVSTDPTFSSPFTNPNGWTVDTENLTVSPTTTNPFTPSTGIDYFWRVCAFSGPRPWITCSSPWSQIWKTRFDNSKGLVPTTGAAPSLIRPTNGFEYAEETPLLQWFPLSGVASYFVQISLDPAFNTTVDTATVSYPSYVPTSSLAQRSLGAVDFGVYYWRVRATGSASWSETRRFQISAQSQWMSARILGDAANRLQIGSDPPAEGGVTAAYDLTDLQVAQSSANWYFGFHVPAYSGTNVTYALYLDLDHQPASPTDHAFFDARGYSVTTLPAYQPEYAIYIVQEAGSFTRAKTYLYHWNGTGWDTVQVFSNIGCYISLNGNYVELEVTNTAINYQDTNGSYAISLVSLPAGDSGAPQDSVPSDPNIPGSGQMSRFANVTERMNLSMPPNDAGIDPSTYPTILPFFWDWPVLSPWAGAIMEARLDQDFTSPVVATFTLTSDTPYYAQFSHAWADDFDGDNTYFWRIRPTYTVAHNLGAWSQGWRFERKGFIPGNLTTSITSATPTFTWDMVEGAESYDLQVSTDPGFGSTAISVNTTQIYYTDQSTLANATYYWRVRVRRNGSVINNWTDYQTFILALPGPTGLTPASDTIVGRAPTLCWTPQIISLLGNPVFAAWKYRVQVSADSTFSTVYDNTDTEQRCWTPTKGYADDTYYWHVASIDGNGRVGNYTAYQTFTKQYPVSTLVSPLNGTNIASTPTFVWTPVNGAARYKLDVSLYSNFTTTVESITTDNTRYTPTNAYAINKTYYWRVAIVDADGKVGPYNNATIILSPYANRIYLPLVKK